MKVEDENNVIRLNIEGTVREIDIHSDNELAKLVLGATRDSRKRIEQLRISKTYKDNGRRRSRKEIREVTPTINKKIEEETETLQVYKGKVPAEIKLVYSGDENEGRRLIGLRVVSVNDVSNF